MAREPKDFKVKDETRYGRKGLLVHVFKDTASDDYEVWWNLDIDFDGLCIGAGKTRREAYDDAYRTLSELSVVLDEGVNEPPVAQGASGGD